MCNQEEVLKTVTVHDEPKQWLGSLATTLRQWYRDSGHKLNEIDAIVEIEHHFGQDLIETMCKPHGMHEGACWLIALSAAKDGYRDR